MPMPQGTRYRVKTYPSGKRVRLAILGDKVLEVASLPRTKPTKTAKHLNKQRSRMHRRTSK